MKPMTAKQLITLLQRAPQDALIWFDNWEYEENGELHLMTHPVNFAQIKLSNNAYDIEDCGITLSCNEAEEYDEYDEQAPIDPTTLTPDQLAVIS